MDVKKLSRFRLPGHRATGRRSERNRGVGYDYLHCVIDDHSRLAYVELHPHEDAETNARTLRVPCASSPTSDSTRPRQ